MIPRVPKATLEPHRDAIRELVAHLGFIESGWRELDDANAYIGLFSTPELLSQLPLRPINELEIFFDCYYWHRFASALSLRNGNNNGYDQEAFKVLAHAPDGVEWELIPLIEAQAMADAAAISGPPSSL